MCFLGVLSKTMDPYIFLARVCPSTHNLWKKNMNLLRICVVLIQIIGDRTFYLIQLSTEKCTTEKIPLWKTTIFKL